jgi:uncharacterized protein involved in exopolysaccharide biosynthesis
MNVWRITWHHRWFVLAVLAMSVGSGLIYVCSASAWYRASVLVEPADRVASKALSTAAGGLTDLADIAGLDLNSAGSAEAVAVLESTEFTEAFISEQKLLPVFFPGAREQPDLHDGVRYFDRYVRRIWEDGKTGLITISIEWTDPNTAAAWANLLVERINEHMRASALEEAQRKIDYLEQEMTTTNIVTARQSIGRLMDKELQKRVLAKGNEEYAFRIIDPAAIPKWPSRPPITVIMILAFGYGFFAPMIFLVSRHVIRRERSLKNCNPAAAAG